MAITDYFLKIDGIPGESKADKHQNEIDVLSWSWGETQPATASFGGGAGASRANMEDFGFTMHMSTATPKLIEACATGTHIKSAILICRKAGKEQQEYLKFTFTDCLISSYQTGGSDSSIIPIDQISINFSKIEFEYKEQKADGTMGGAVKTGYDLKLNKKV